MVRLSSLNIRKAAEIIIMYARRYISATEDEYKAAAVIHPMWPMEE